MGARDAGPLCLGAEEDLRGGLRWKRESLETRGMWCARAAAAKDPTSSKLSTLHLLVKQACNSDE